MELFFSQVLSGFRKRSGLTQKELADAIGISRVAISNWESGNYLPRYPDVVERLAEVLNLSKNETDQLLIAAKYPSKYGVDENENELRAKLQGIKLTLDELEIERDKGMIDIGRYLRLKEEYETRKAKLERLDNLVDDQLTLVVTPPERLPILKSPLSLESMRPPKVTGFVGRESELVYYGEKLETSHQAIICGLAGVGKTWLAAALAEQSAVPDRTFWHEFNEGQGVDGVIWKLANFLFHHGQKDLWLMLNSSQVARLPPTEMLFDRLFELLRGQGYLVCFDNWQEIKDDPDLVQLTRLLRKAVELKELSVIITSRHEVTLAQTSDFEPLTGLSIDDTHRLLASQGLSLSQDIENRLYQRTEGNAKLLDLAIGALKHSKDHEVLVNRLSKTRGIKGFLRTIDEGLTKDEQAIMSAVAVLLGYPGTRDVVEGILDRGGVQRVFDSLQRYHLLTVREGEVDEEYKQHDIVRTFYYNQLGKLERRPMHYRAGEYYETEERDVVKAIRHFLKAEEHGQAADLIPDDIWVLINQGHARALHDLFAQFSLKQLDKEQQISVNLARGQVCTFLRQGQQAQECYQGVLSQLTDSPDSPAVRELKARAYHGMGEAIRFENPGEAQKWLQRGLDELADVDVLEKALLYLGLGSILKNTNDLRAASNALEQSLQLLPEGHSDWRASAMANLGVVHAKQENIDVGKEYFERALEIYQVLHNYWGMIGVWQNLGMALEISGDWSRAVAEYNKAIEQAERLGSVERQVELELCTGILLTNQGDFETAQARLSGSLELARRHHLKVQQVYIQSWLAELQVRLEDWEAAKKLLKDAEQLALELDVKDQLPEIYRGWAQVQLGQTEYQAALDYAEQSLNLAREMGSEEGMSLRVLGQALVASGKRERAVEAFESSLALLEDYDPYEAARTKAQWGLTLVQGGDVAKGKRLLEEARATFQDLDARYDERAVDALDIL